MNNSEPKPLKEILKDPKLFSHQPDEDRRVRVIRADLQSEVVGLTDLIEDVHEGMRRTGDPLLPQVLDQVTEASMLAQRELRDHLEDGIQKSE